MALESTWRSLLHLRKSHFKYPDQINDAILVALDRFINQVGSMPAVLSDFRPGDPRQHGKGMAIDVAWPNLDTLAVWNQALAARLFNGLGVYYNERGAVSFHFDTRADRTPENPATWGAFITPGVSESGEQVRRYAYVGAADVLEEVKKKPLLLSALLGLGVIGYLLNQSTLKK